ncbi:FAD-dependent oxidoreductase, partial [Microbacterium sp. H83]|uniref:FAD-dependent oxidoreductase n=1 Tax=Microbacterium sp. H83 TaxID=1827324 RepID=UPI000B140EE4
TERGAIDIDDHMRTNVEGIYAIGDVTAKLQLAHVAEAQGVVAAETIGGAETQTLRDYGNMSSATILFVIRRILDQGARPGERVAAMAFGPGLTAESALMTVAVGAA